MTKRSRAGSALLEVVIALVVLAVSGTAFITLLGQTTHSIERLRRSERETRGASAQLSRLATFDRGQLMARVGRTAANGWLISIDQLSAGLFDVSVAASDTSGTSGTLLRTTLYRPDSVNGATP
jgi:Tfp pilus assembly protein PilV